MPNDKHPSGQDVSAVDIAFDGARLATGSPAFDEQSELLNGKKWCPDIGLQSASSREIDYSLRFSDIPNPSREHLE